jgi:hypothetical protein
MRLQPRTFGSALSLIALLAFNTPSLASEFAFTYQGELQDGAAPANGVYDIRLEFLNAQMFPAQFLCADGVNVSNGRFTITVDPGAAFQIEAPTYKFLRLSVRPDSGLGCNDLTGYVVLNPPQPMTYAPVATHARYAEFSSNSQTAAALQGFGPSYFTNAANLTGTLPASTLGPTVPRTDQSNVFVGATNTFQNVQLFDVQVNGSIRTPGIDPLDIIANNVTAYRIDAPFGFANIVAGADYNQMQGPYAGFPFGGVTIAGGAWNVVGDSWATIGGGQGNEVRNVFGTIAGGGPTDPAQRSLTNNRVYDWYGTIGGGGGNRAGIDSPAPNDGEYATVSGGRSNFAIGAYSSILGGTNNATSSGFSTVAGGATNTASGFVAFVGGGDANSASGERSVVSGGAINQAVGRLTTVAGGEANLANGAHASIGGGYTNQTGASFARVGGGENNHATGVYSVASGGRGNRSTTQYATVGGGVNNTAGGGGFSTVAGGSENDATGFVATVAGGDFNLASGDRSFIGGGNGHIASGAGSAIGGGFSNRATADVTTVGGGSSNQATVAYATVGGGNTNRAQALNATVAGGAANNAGFPNSYVGGGSANSALNEHATIGGGNNNSATGTHGTVAGGQFNQASGQFSTVSGGGINQALGDYATSIGGNNGYASGSFSTSAGGFANRATGAYSFAAGKFSQANHDGTFVWGDSLRQINTPTQSTGANQFIIMAAGGTCINTTGPTIRPASEGGLMELTVGGDLSAFLKFFRIDHPLDPANKELLHACVESDEYKNIYDGVVTTDENGFATVTMPDWFGALNESFRYQLTVIDDSENDFVLAKVYRKLGADAPNAFTIKTSAPGVEVSWQLTGVRKDPYAKSRPMSVEIPKPAERRGTYLYKGYEALKGTSPQAN